MSDSDKLIDLEQLGVLAGAPLLAMVIMRILHSPARPFVQTTILGSSLGLDLSESTLMLPIILGLSVTAMIALIRNHPRSRQGALDSWTMFWIVPGLLNLGLAAWLNRVDDLESWLIGLAVAAVLIPASMVVECHAVNPELRAIGRLRLPQLLLNHLAAAILFALIYDARSRSLLSASAILLVATLLAARLLWTNEISVRRAFLYGCIPGLILAQTTWGLNYWRLSGLQGGLFLLMLYYVVVGLLQQFLLGQFGDGQNSRRILAEYGSTGVIILLLIVLIVP